LGQVPVVAQKSLTVTRPGPVIAALARNKLAVLKNHGVVSIGRTCIDTLAPIQILEEAVKTVCVARLFRIKSLDGIDRAIQKYLQASGIP
jgi:ribulose-5-phosphate 4-epimerase/fuculose-1-phosphate aldolase